MAQGTGHRAQGTGHRAQGTGHKHTLEYYSPKRFKRLGKFQFVSLSILLALLWAGCEWDEDEPENGPSNGPGYGSGNGSGNGPGETILGNLANFTAFSFAGMEGAATLHEATATITARASSATHVANIIPTFTVSKGAKVTVDGMPQQSGITSNNFTSPVTYTVVSEDNRTTKLWTVTISLRKAGEVTELTSAMINAQAQVTLSPGIYQVKNDLTLNNGNTLTLLPGVEIRFDKGRRLTTQVNARMVAKGTQEQPIVFTSSLHIPQAGDWYGLYLNGTHNEFDGCVFEYGAGQSNYYGMLHLHGGAASFTNSVFRHSKYSAIYLNQSNSRLDTFENNTLHDCGENEAGAYPILVNSNLSSLGDMGENVIATAKGIGVSGETVSRNVTLKAFVPYLFYGDVTVDNNATLTIEPGAVLKFGANRKLAFNAGAKVIARGTAQAPILFTSNRQIPSPGDWYGIYINNSNGSLFEHCIFEYGAGQPGGYGMLYLNNSKASFANCTFRHARYSGILLRQDNSGFTAFDNNKLSNCGENEAGAYPIRAASSIMTLSGMGANNEIDSAKGIGIVGSTVNADLTLRKYLYTIAGDITVSQTGVGGATLTVVPGAELMFAQNTRLRIGAGGRLLAQGTPAENIVFTGSTQDRGWWHGIVFDSGNALSGSILNRCRISYGGAGTSTLTNGNITSNGLASGVLTVRNSVLSHSRAWGIYVANGSHATLENNTYSNNGQANASNVGYGAPGANHVIGNY